jgi:2-iminobutanoate/2-iminopropanoate deaminase
MQSIATPEAPRPAGHYSQAVTHGGLVFVAGQLPLDPVSGTPVGTGDVEVQTEQVLRNVEAVLRAAGSGLDRLLSVTLYLTDRGFWGQVNQVYARVLGDHRPARAIVPVPELRPGCLIEMQAIAARTE